MISQKLIRQPADKGQVSRQRGFTLIEIMVVILIIGILSSVVLAFLGDARNNARDSKIKSEMDSFRRTAELASQNGEYPTELSGGLCDILSRPLLQSIRNTTPDPDSLECVTDGNNYSVEVELYKDSEMFCVDSQGFAGIGTNSGGLNTFCTTP